MDEPSTAASLPSNRLNSLGKRLLEIDAGFLAVGALCLLAVWPFLTNPSLPQATDAELHIFRLAEMSRLVRGGELFPRWAPNFYFGYGYPIFNFYAPLTYQLGLIFDFMPLLGPVHAVKILFIAGIFLSGLGMYGLVRDIWGRGAGLVAAASYVYAPFVMFVDPYARGDLPESFSFGIFAVALWALNRLRLRPSWKNWLTSVLLTAALILTHNLMSMVFFGILLAWTIWQLAFERSWRVKLPVTGVVRALFSYRLLIALVLAVGLSAYFWLPVVLESDTVNLGTLIGEGGHFDFRNNFLKLPELFGGASRLDWGATESDYSLNLGLTQLILGITGAAGLLSKRARKREQALFFLIASLVLLLLMVRASTFLWELIPVLPFLQFPWRLLGPAAAMLAVMGGFGVSVILGYFPEKSAGWITALMIAVVLLGALPLAHVPPWNEEFGETSPQRVLEYELAGRWLGTTSTADFVPTTVETLPRPAPTLVESIKSGGTIDRVNRVTLPLNTEVIIDAVTPLRTLYHVTGDQAFLLRLFQFDFPGWTAAIDGENAETELGLPEGFLVIPVPAGEHTVEVAFNNTGERKIAYLISAAALVAALAASWQFFKLSTALETAYNKIDDSPIESVKPWPAFGISLAMLAIFAFVIEPSGLMRYDSTGFSVEVAQHDIFADFGQQVALIGYDLNPVEVNPGDEIELTLYWKAINPLEINYQVFAHVLDSNGQIITQSDKLNPGDFPTKRWPLDKYVRDEHLLVIPESAAPGKYPLSVGLWAEAEGWRLPLLDEKGQQIGDSYQLPLWITIEE